MKKQIINLTQRAKNKLIEMSQENKSHLLLSVKGGGCNGFVYDIQPIVNQDIEKLDEIIPLNEDKNLIVDNKSIFYLLNTQIDWEKNFMGETFSFQNPNVKNTCGCNYSFAIDTEIKE